MSADRPARPPVRLQYLMWDGTKAIDSRKLATRLSRSFRCINLLDDCPAGEFGVLGSPRIFQPCGAKGKDTSAELWVRGLFDFPLQFFKPKHKNAGGDLPAILQYSGHGIPGFMFSESAVLIATSRPMKLNSLTPELGAQWEFINRRWDNESTKVVIFSACRQLAGRPQQFNWSERMRGASNRVRTILTYRNTAPDPSTSVDINDSFVSNLAKGETFIKAWSGAHGKGLGHRWAALVFRSAIDDKMTDWVRDGSLAADPAADEDILYFDSETPAGRVVTEPKFDFNASMTILVPAAPPLPPLIPGSVMPPWTLVSPGTLVTLHLDFLTGTFQDGDRLWIGALQVRPDYHGPFRIENLIRFTGHDRLIASGDVAMFGRLHDETAKYKADSYTDLYEFEVNREAMPVGVLDENFSRLNLSMEIVGKPNNHLAVFYLMFRLERGTTEFGIKTSFDSTRFISIADQRKLIDQPQFCVFLIRDS